MCSAVVVISAEPAQREQLSAIVSSCGFHPVPCETLAAARELFSRQRFRLALCEDILPDGNFQELIATVRNSPGLRMPVIVVSRVDDWGSFLEAMMAGAFDYVGFPPYPHELERALAAALCAAEPSRSPAFEVAA